MKTHNQSETAREMDKQGLRVYVLCAAIVYILAIGYCYYTSHFFEMELVGGVTIGLGIFVSWIYSSLSATPEKKNMNNKTGKYESDLLCEIPSL